MSGWDGYVNDMMKDTGVFDNAVVFSTEDYGVWATTSSFSISEEEAANLIKIAGSRRTQDSMKAAIFKVNGIEYEPILIEKGRIYAEKISNRNAGVLAMISKQCAIVGTYPPAVAPGSAADSIENLAIYLGEQGF